MSDPGCGRVDPEQEKQWEKHKRECLARFREMEKAEREAKRIVKIQDLEGRRAALAILGDLYGAAFLDMTKNFLKSLWATRATAKTSGRSRRG